MSSNAGATKSENDKQPLRLTICIALVLALLSSASIVWLLAANQLGHWPVWERPGSITGEQWRSHISNAAALVGVPVVAAALVFSYFRQKTNDETRLITAKVLQLQNAQHVASEAAAMRARYVTAAEQLGHDRASVRLAGVHSMVSVADGWEGAALQEDRQAAVNVLTGFFRMHSHTKGAKSRIAASAAWQALAERCAGTAGAKRWDTDVDLRGILIPPGGLPKLAVSGRRFDLGGSTVACQPMERSGTTYTAIPFEGISVTGGTLSFAGAALDKCGLLFSNGAFTGGALNLGVKATAAVLPVPDLPCITFRRCKFDGTDVQLDTSVGSGIGLRVAFEECRFGSGQISFAGAEMLDSISFRDCHFDGGTTFVPPGDQRSTMDQVNVKIEGDYREAQVPAPGPGWVILDERIHVKRELQAEDPSTEPAASKAWFSKFFNRKKEQQNAADDERSQV